MNVGVLGCTQVPFQIGIFLEPVRILYDVEFIQRTGAVYYHVHGSVDHFLTFFEWGCGREICSEVGDLFFLCSFMYADVTCFVFPSHSFSCTKGVELLTYAYVYVCIYLCVTVAFFKPASKWIVRSMMEAAMHLVDRVRRQTWVRGPFFLSCLMSFIVHYRPTSLVLGATHRETVAFFIQFLFPISG